MTWIADIVSRGISPRQHWDSDYDLNMRLVTYSARVERNEKLESKGAYKVVDNTAGDDLAWTLWERRSEEARKCSAWAASWPVVVSFVDVLRETHEAGAIDYALLPDQGAGVYDERFQTLPAATAAPGWASRFPVGWTGTVCAGTNETDQYETWHPDFLGLVVDRGGETSTRVFQSVLGSLVEEVSAPIDTLIDVWADRDSLAIVMGPTSPALYNPDNGLHYLAPADSGGPLYRAGGSDRHHNGSGAMPLHMSIAALWVDPARPDRDGPFRLFEPAPVSAPIEMGAALHGGLSWDPTRQWWEVVVEGAFYPEPIEQPTPTPPGDQQTRPRPPTGSTAPSGQPMPQDFDASNPPPQRFPEYSPGTPSRRPPGDNSIPVSPQYKDQGHGPRRDPFSGFGLPGYVAPKTTHGPSKALAERRAKLKAKQAETRAKTLAKLRERESATAKARREAREAKIKERRERREERLKKTRDKNRDRQKAREERKKNNEDYWNAFLAELHGRKLTGAKLGDTFGRESRDEWPVEPLISSRLRERPWIAPAHVAMGQGISFRGQPWAPGEVDLSKKKGYRQGDLYAVAQAPTTAKLVGFGNNMTGSRRGWVYEGTKLGDAWKGPTSAGGVVVMPGCARLEEYFAGTVKSALMATVLLPRAQNSTGGGARLAFGTPGKTGLPLSAVVMGMDSAALWAVDLYTAAGAKESTKLSISSAGAVTVQTGATAYDASISIARGQDPGVEEIPLVPKISMTGWIDPPLGIQFADCNPAAYTGIDLAYPALYHRSATNDRPLWRESASTGDGAVHTLAYTTDATGGGSMPARYCEGMRIRTTGDTTLAASIGSCKAADGSNTIEFAVEKTADIATGHSSSGGLAQLGGLDEKGLDNLSSGAITGSQSTTAITASASIVSHFNPLALTGTISTVGTALTGSSTKFLTELSRGDLVGSATTYGWSQVLSVESDTAATLKVALPGGNATTIAATAIHNATIWCGTDAAMKARVESLTANGITATVKAAASQTVGAGGALTIGCVITAWNDPDSATDDYIWLAVWAVSDGSTTGLLFSTQHVTLLAAPSGYTIKRRIGWVHAYVGEDNAAKVARARYDDGVVERVAYGQPDYLPYLDCSAGWTAWYTNAPRTSRAVLIDFVGVASKTFYFRERGRTDWGQGENAILTGAAQLSARFPVDPAQTLDVYSPDANEPAPYFLGWIDTLCIGNPTP